MWRITPDKLLEAVRVAGAAVLADLVLLAARAPGGYLGASGELTSVGRLFLVGQLALVLVAVVAILGGVSVGRALALVVLAIHVGFFALPVATDPVPVGALLLWQVMIFFQILGRSSAMVKRASLDWVARNGPVARHIVLVSLVAWIVAFGFQVITHPLALGLCGILSALALGVGLSFLVALWRAGRRWQVLTPWLGLAAALVPGLGWERALLGLAGFEALILLMILVRMPIQAALLKQFMARPPALLVSTFVLLVAAGSVLLSFPASTASGRPLLAVDALFTAASATCVTGLTVVDTGSELSFFGQLVVLISIQAGGLGILVLSGFAALLLGEGMGLRGERALGESLDLSSGGAERLARFIVVSTFSLEALGAIGLGLAFVRSGMTPGDALWSGIFHSVSAFCNAGFALWVDSLAAFRGDPWVLLTFAALITLGGLGFPVLIAGWARAQGRRNAFSTHAKVVLVASAILTVVGAVVYGISEGSRTLATLDLGDRMLSALFQSVTLRTAGFTVAEVEAVGPATFLLMLILMFIGASPGSTGGGVKTTTAAVLATSVPAAIMGGGRAVLYGRSVPLESVFRAASILVLTLVTAALVLGALVLTQPIAFDRLLFETISALGTVGLSQGVTGQLDTFGKLVITLTMLIGRVGPLTLVLLFARRSKGRLRYPEARIMVG